MGKRVRHFVGTESSEQLRFIDELHALGLSNDLKLPELVVVGDQSSGKSSVLQAITEIDFPIGEGTCTRFPIQFSFRQTPRSQEACFEASIVVDEGTETDVAFLHRANKFHIEGDELTPALMKDIIRQATECMFGKDNAADKMMSHSILRIVRSGPEEMHWTITDLPGLFGKNEQDTRLSKSARIAERLTRKYLANERNIVLIVCDNKDINLNRGLELASASPDILSRCIGILNKCDRREEGAGQWMVKLLQNEPDTTGHLKTHGWFGLRNRAPKESRFTDQQRDEIEAKEFAKQIWHGVPKNRTGIKCLMDYVDGERRAQLQEGIPHIIEEIKGKLDKCQTELDEMGVPRTDPGSQRAYIGKLCHMMENMAERAISGRAQDDISPDQKAQLRYLVQERLDKFAVQVYTTWRFDDYDQSLRRLAQSSDNMEGWEKIVTADEKSTYAQIYRQAAICRGEGLPGNIHPDVEKRVFRKLSAQWGDFARDAIKDAKGLVLDCYDALLRLAIKDRPVRLEVARIVAKGMETWEKDADRAFDELWEDETKRQLMTYDPRFDEYQRSADQMRDTILLGETSQDRAVNGVKKPPRFIPPELSQVLRTRARLQIYYDIAIYRFIDNVAMQVIERHVLGSKCPLRVVSSDLVSRLDDKELQQVAGEREADAQKRERLTKAIDKYTKALKTWEQLRVL